MSKLKGAHGESSVGVISVASPGSIHRIKFYFVTRWQECDYSCSEFAVISVDVISEEVYVPRLTFNVDKLLFYYDYIYIYITYNLSF